MERIGNEELKNRSQEIKNKIRENGVTYNIYQHPGGLNSPWKLDLIPFLIEQKEWLAISKGLQQRAILLDLILRDIYSDRNLIKDGVLPAELVYNNTGFFRACHDVKSPTQNQLIMYAADMARGPDGRMWVVDNRTQAPSGSGYALENRVIISKIIPELASGMYISRLSPFFTQAQQSIFKVFRERSEYLNVVYLTPGPNNETYFEQAYLASYLGYTLVQGDDLIVKNGFVWIKAIDGLQRVDIIIRRIDDEWCDPLELRLDSRLGVPGLLQVIRNGNVMVINPPGSSAVENSAFNAFLPSLCRYFLKEELILPSVATWWCGQPKELQSVLDNLDKLIIKKANRKQVFRSVYGKELSADQLQQLRLQILQNPADYVAQEEVSFSTAPAFVDGYIEPRYAAIRAFLTATPTGYQVMEGGLTRSSAVKDKFTFSNQYGSVSKDTWIVSDEAEIIRERIKLPATSYQQSQASLPSRSAENLYWAARYSERSMSATSFLMITLNALNFQRNFGSENKTQHIDILLKTISNLIHIEPYFSDEKKDDFKNPYPIIAECISNAAKVGTITSTIQSFLMTMIAVRERWNIVTWRTIDVVENINQKLQQIHSNQNPNEIHNTLNNLQSSLFTFYGIVSESIPRNNGYYLFETGKLIERILSKITIIKSIFSIKTEPFIENELMEVVLMNHFALSHYRSTYKTNFEKEYVLDMILLDKHIPSSLAYLLDSLDHTISQLPQTSGRLSKSRKAILEAVTQIKLIDIAGIATVEPESQAYEKLSTILSQVYSLILSVSDYITDQYFNHTATQHSITETIVDLENEL
ncbi:circularly permuted type 2 ATP-grasp protein [Spirosoma sp. KNUC1025]|uniref:circularly permuted type 2 ATP-grasp protein n=1 Tax=Spirosoma sp. KNUC1025 TaxID=2894082 RepID=UPI00386CB5BA|nr:circularly permuted type 2 ATP-grasp protein [Spirosoma sp. KNUC1025]